MTSPFIFLILKMFWFALHFLYFFLFLAVMGLYYGVQTSLAVARGFCSLSLVGFKFHRRSLVWARDQTMSPTLEGRFLTTGPHRKFLSLLSWRKFLLSIEFWFHSLKNIRPFFMPLWFLMRILCLLKCFFPLYNVVSLLSRVFIPF